MSNCATAASFCDLAAMLPPWVSPTREEQNEPIVPYRVLLLEELKEPLFFYKKRGNSYFYRIAFLMLVYHKHFLFLW